MHTTHLLQNLNLTHSVIDMHTAHLLQSELPPQQHHNHAVRKVAVCGINLQA
jgi:hypothetical protein